MVNRIRWLCERLKQNLQTTRVEVNRAPLGLQRDRKAPEKTPEFTCCVKRYI